MNNMRIARIAAGYNQKQVALTLHVSAPTVSDWESGKIYPSASNLVALSNLYHTSIDYLLGRSMIGQYLAHRQGDASDEDFSATLGIDSSLLCGLKYGFFKTARDGRSAHSECLSEDDIVSIASALMVDKNYIGCLADEINPHLVSDVRVPSDDLTRPPMVEDTVAGRKYFLFSPQLGVFGHNNFDEIYSLCCEMNEEGQERLLEYARDLVAGGRYIKKAGESVVGEKA